jgi:hypothetical protein
MSFLPYYNSHTQKSDLDTEMCFCLLNVASLDEVSREG